MRIVIQRVKKATVHIDEKLKSEIAHGLLVFVGIEDNDTVEDSEWLSGKLSGLRIFNDELGVMNKSVMEVNGEILIVSQFTLHALTKKGNRPSYIKAAKHEHAIPMYEHFCSTVSSKTGKQVKTGTFAANMQVSLVNDGPVTIWIDSKNKE